jgi:MSHA pilin protein MshA
MVNGYPQAVQAGITDAAQVAGDYTITHGAAAGGEQAVYTLTAVAGCTVTYTAATAATDNVNPITAAPQVVVDPNGC